LGEEPLRSINLTIKMARENGTRADFLREPANLLRNSRNVAAVGRESCSRRFERFAEQFCKKMDSERVGVLERDSRNVNEIKRFARIGQNRKRLATFV
jgi:hypothetical protein